MLVKIQKLNTCIQTHPQSNNDCGVETKEKIHVMMLVKNNIIVGLRESMAEVAKMKVSAERKTKDIKVVYVP